VPNTIRLGHESAVTERGDFDVMMLTGPNTGGKTVVLKTLGLLTAMVGCGLHVPAQEGSWLSLPGEIHVDIGDEQSIEQSLSTFSGHLKNIVGILKRVQPYDLVLFDEIGAGTDPDEGAALANAVLRALSRRGAHVVATTHYGELKQFALSAQRFENASVEFDPRTLQPTYKLRIGVPGASNALDIAARLGMPPELVQRARKYLGTDRLESEAATQRLEETQRELTEQTEAVRREREEVERLRRDYERRLERAEAAREKELDKARREAREVIDRAQSEADEALRELRRATRATGGNGENRETEVARGRLRTLRERVVVSTFDDKKERKRENRVEETKKENSAPKNLPLSSPPVAPISVSPGDIVTVKSLSREAEVLRVEGNRVELRVGAMKVEAKLADLTPTKAGPVQGVGTAISTRKSWNVGDEINLIGQSSAEAIPALEKYLDDAILAGLPQIRIVHGRGSGALKRAVHEFLRGFGSRFSFETAPQNEGGEGATVVKLS
jgi:DNA mismatch repair protein MutS2